MQRERCRRFRCGFRSALSNRRLPRGQAVNENSVLSSAFAAAKVGLVVLDGAARVVNANPEFCRLLGRGQEDALGLEFLSLVQSPSPEVEVLRAVLQGHQVHDGARSVPFVVGPDTVTWGRLTLAPLPPTAAGGGWIGTVEAVDAGPGRGRSVLAPDSQTLEAVSLLAGGVAHEINNPLMGLMGFAQLLEDRVGTTAGDYIASLLEQAARIHAIAAHLLAFSGRSGDGFAAELSREILVSPLEAAASAMAADGIAFRTRIPEGPGPPVRCNGLLLQQALLNLFENARDSVRPLPVTGGRRWVEFELTSLEPQGRPWARFVVRDGGGGIPLPRTQGLFDPLCSERPEGADTALRIAITRRIAQRHGGRLVFESENGQAAFVLELPLGQADTFSRSVDGSSVRS